MVTNSRCGEKPEEAMRTGEIGARAQVTVLIGEGEIGDSFARLRAGLVAIVGGLKVLGVQLGRDRLRQPRAAVEIRA